MSFYYQPDVDALKEVISSKRAALKGVEDQIADTRLKMLGEQDVAEVSTFILILIHHLNNSCLAYS